MKILSIKSNSKYFQLNKNEDIESNQKTKYQNIPFSYPKGYTPYFGARLHRTPENFFSQDFNLENMPSTVKSHLMTDYENNKLKKPIELQREAYADLELCENIDDIKEMFPNEELFKDLKDLKTLKSPRGYLYDLRYLSDKNNNSVLKSGEDFTVYLVKKVYLEGKDLKEINEDFKKDVKEELLDNEHYPNGYFQYSTLKAIGVNFPNRAYWKSLQATREDKEYIPYTVTVDPNRVRKPHEYKPRIITPEEKQRRSQRMVNRWLEMTPEQRARQIEKMRAGMVDGANSILFEYLSPIMIISAEKADLSEKMIKFFSKNSSSEECPQDLSKVTKSQNEKLKKFWDENPKMKENFSNAIVSTIKEFEDAKTKGEKEIEGLINKAALISSSNEAKALKRKKSDPKVIQQEIVSLLHKQNSFYPDIYVNSYEKFLTGHKLFQSQIIPAYKKLTVDNNPHMQKTVQEMIENVHNEFMKKNKKVVLASNIAVASALNRHININNLYTYTPGGIIIIVHKLGLANEMNKQKPEIEAKYEKYSKDLTDDELNQGIKGIIRGMGYVLLGGYRTLIDYDVHQRKTQLLPKIFKAVSKSKHERAKLREILKDYTPYLRFIMEPNIPKSMQIYMLESLIDECLINFDLKK